jgi:hypothetical protein
VIDPHQIGQVQCRALRLSDDTPDLRVGSINIINEIVGLTFSCDGFHVRILNDILTRMDAHQYKNVSRLRRLHW